MRFVLYASPQGPRAAVVRNGGYVDVQSADPDLPVDLLEIVAAGPSAWGKLIEAVERATPAKPATVRLLPPVPQPQKVICVGLNYADHAKESGMDPPEEPVIFNKFTTAVAAHEDDIVLPSVSMQVDYEAELVVIIGRGGRNIPEAEALDHVAGYTIGNDVSARDWQLAKPGKQWLLGKSFDTFAPIGPALVTKDEVPDPNRLAISLRLNGDVLQDSNTSQFIFKVEELIAYVSQVCTLAPGDVIFTGTPPGVGFARDPQIFLKPGDEVEVEIEALGVLRNKVVAAE